MWSVGISVSPCSDAARIGYDNRQINRIVIRMSQFFLDQNMRVIFGHDWREDGVMRAVADFAAIVAARRSEAPDETPCLQQPNGGLEWRMLNVVETEHKQLSRAALEAKRASGGVLEVIPLHDVEDCVRESGTMYQNKHIVDERAKKLTLLREHLTKRLDPGCRICLGGKTDGYEGSKPGVEEEAELALEYGKPLYLVGGFGGATRSFGENRCPELNYWRAENGLDEQEKLELFETTDVERALRLITGGIQASKRKTRTDADWQA